jgi:tRNA (guanine-N7-)-methyltransferase
MTEYRDADHIRSYVRRATHMSASQRRAYGEYRERYCIAESERRRIALLPEGERTAELVAGFECVDAPLIVEIGFGMGDATAKVAEQNPRTNYLGVEVHRPGVGKLLSRIADMEIRNVRIIEEDAIVVLETLLTPESVDGFHLFFPDPWPKKRHHKRRLVRPGVVALLASRLKPGGYVYMATDWEEYALEAIELLGADAVLENPYDGFAPRKQWRPVTAFERKGSAAGRHIREIIFRRLPCT